MTLAISASHANQLARLRARSPELRVVMIGAAALGHHVELERVTLDVDLAIVIDPADIQSLLAPLGWTRDRKLAIRWHGPDGFRTDIMPAPPDLLARGAIPMDGGDSEMRVIGFDLALDHATDVALPGTAETISVASLAALVVLKMVAWLDRPTERSKDLGDIALVLEQALPDDDDRRWDASDPVAASGVAHDLQSAYFVGLQVGGVARDHHREVEAFLSLVLAEDGHCSAMMARAAGRYALEGDERVRTMLETFRSGVEAARGLR